MSLVAVLIVSHRAAPDARERLSLAQCCAVLGRYPVKLVLPAEIDPAPYLEVAPGLEVTSVHPDWLSSHRMHSHLMVSSLLYRRFRRYRYLLIHELDSLVLRDELLAWCARGYDYIGAPWFEGYGTPTSKRLLGAGNGGFSLRRVSTHRTLSRLMELRRLPATRHAARGTLSTLASLLWHTTPTRRQGLYGPDLLEDGFWCRAVKERVPGYRVASPQLALRFGFEVWPRRMLELAGGRLPFGCHGWWREDPAFWAEVLERHIAPEARPYLDAALAEA